MPLNRLPAAPIDVVMRSPVRAHQRHHVIRLQQSGAVVFRCEMNSGASSSTWRPSEGPLYPGLSCSPRNMGETDIQVNHRE